MSINSALLAGVSGLVANSSALAAISDNIANVNTTAYKRKSVNFASVVTAQAVQGRYSAGGVTGVTHRYVSQQGLIQASSSSTDMAISGDGFFLATDKSNATPTDPRVFTRDGSFTVDADGFLVNNGDFYLQGWLVQPDGTFDVSPSDVGKLSAINVKNGGGAVTPTSQITLVGNLDKGSVTGTAVDMEVKFIDAAGGAHNLQLTFTKNATPGVWDVALATVPPSDTVGAFPAGQVTFNQDGSIDLTATDLGDGTTTDVTINDSGGAAPAWSVPLDLPAQTFNIDLSKLTQLADKPSGVDSVSQNGAGAGNVIGVQVDEEGIVSALFDNSQVREIAKVAIATFPNPDGLLAASGNAYRATLDAGQFVIKEPGTNAAGKISPSSLEASSVDLSAEFTGLIVTQRAYSASAKIITTADQMLEELINIKR